MGELFYIKSVSLLGLDNVFPPGDLWFGSITNMNYIVICDVYFNV